MGFFRHEIEFVDTWWPIPYKFPLPEPLLFDSMDSAGSVILLLKHNPQRIYTVFADANIKIFPPDFKWTKHDIPSDVTIYSENPTIFQHGQGNDGRLIRVKALKFGVLGYIEKHLKDDIWKFVESYNK